MKRKMIGIIILILIGLVVVFVISNRKCFLSRTNNYKVYNEKGESLPILIFDRSTTQKFNEDSIMNKEILLYFNVGIENESTNGAVLSILLEQPHLYGVDGGNSQFTKLGNLFLFQHNPNRSDEYWPLYNNGLTYVNKQDEPIRFFIAKGNTYKFNTFGHLKVFGDTIIIEKLDGAIEKEGVYVVDE